MEERRRGTDGRREKGWLGGRGKEMNVIFYPRAEKLTRKGRKDIVNRNELKVSIIMQNFSFHWPLNKYI